MVNHKTYQRGWRGEFFRNFSRDSAYVPHLPNGAIIKGHISTADCEHPPRLASRMLMWFDEYNTTTGMRYIAPCTKANLNTSVRLRISANSSINLAPNDASIQVLSGILGFRSWSHWPGLKELFRILVLLLQRSWSGAGSRHDNRCNPNIT